jgi:hypothetical protein
MLGFLEQSFVKMPVCIIQTRRLIDIMKHSSFCCSPQSLTGITFIPLRGKCSFPEVCRQTYDWTSAQISLVVLYSAYSGFCDPGFGLKGRIGQGTTFSSASMGIYLGSFFPLVTSNLEDPHESQSQLC